MITRDNICLALILATRVCRSFPENSQVGTTRWCAEVLVLPQDDDLGLSDTTTVQEPA